MSNRCIKLRRPAVLQQVEGMFVPRDIELSEVDARWRKLCERNSAYFDGRIWHVVGVHRNGYGGAVLHVIDCAYRFYAVQDAGFDCGCRSLGAKAITWRDGRVLIGRRSKHVAGYPGCWEFAPGGAVEPGTSPAETVREELAEESGLAVVGEPVPIALLFDGVLRCWEMVYRVQAGDGEPQPIPSEYDELQWCEPLNLPPDMTPIAVQMKELICFN